jgi:preprotein translocase subunit SecG
LLADFARIHLRTFLEFLTSDTYIGVLLRRSKGGSAVFHFGGTWSGVFGRDAEGPGHVTGCPGRNAPSCCFHGGSGSCGSASTLGYVLERPTWLVALGGVTEFFSGERCRGIL